MGAPTRRDILAAGGNGRRACISSRAKEELASGKGSVRIYYEVSRPGSPLMLLPGGGLNATILLRW